MRYDFDEVLDLTGGNSLKWEGYKGRWGRDDLLPLWVADMDFRTPPFVINAIRKQLESGVLGYSTVDKDWAPAIISWQWRRHAWKIKAKELTFMPGIVKGIGYTVLAFTQKDDTILMHDPVYHPFQLVPRAMGRKVRFNELVYENGTYHIDFDRFAEDVKGCRLFILSNPHNPGGIVWSREDLEKMARICKEAGCIVVSDEIHADLALPGHTHIPFASVCEEAASNCITFGAPTKAFNLPGVITSYCIVQDDSLRRCFFNFLAAGEYNDGNMFAYAACAACYNEGEEWLEQVTAYIQSNIDFLGEYLRENIPAISFIRPEASFLVFLDCRALGLPQDKLVDLFVDKAHLALNDGTTFGPGGEGFMRLNVGCPRATLTKALEQLKAGIVSHEASR